MTQKDQILSRLSLLLTKIIQNLYFYYLQFEKLIENKARISFLVTV